MEQSTSKYITLLKDDYIIFLNYLKARIPTFHNSNLFFRDLHYAIKTFLEIKDMKVSYAESELLTTEFSEFLESKGILVKVNELGWKLNYTEFTTVKQGDPF